MSRAARATLDRSAVAWGEVERRRRDSEQARLAEATARFVRPETATLDAFTKVLRGEKTLSTSTRGTLRSLAEVARDVGPLPSKWANNNPIRVSLSDALSSLAHGWDSATSILQLHIAV